MEQVLGLRPEIRKGKYASETLPVTVTIDRDWSVRDLVEGIMYQDEFDQKVKPLLQDKRSSRKVYQMLQTVPQTSPGDTQIRHCMHGMQRMHVDFS